ncbi:unnamed protein product [Brassica napus]|uniref:(rape) hypothetical protein n=1 Tax=Brassica napus TaxID=3708 RepID=A0A816YLY9_BRANA|nr:unnamed protein product [Brassica napus]
MKGDDEQNRNRESDLTLASATPEDEQNRNPRNESGQTLATADPPARRYKRFTVEENKAIEDGKERGRYQRLHRNMTGTAATADLTTPLRVIFHHEASLVELITTNFPRVEKYLDVVTSIVRSKEKIVTTSQQLEKFFCVHVEEVTRHEVNTGGTEMGDLVPPFCTWKK